ncbi:MAG: MFS transporter [Thermoleophilaceae bacterium]
MQRKWWTLIAASIATFMLLLDITVVNTALPDIERDLGASFTDLQWVIDAYTLSLAAFVLTAGSIADRVGRKRTFVVGLGVFTVASLFIALAPSATALNIGRAVQGVGGAIMFALSLALIAQEFRGGRERGTAMGVYGATIGISVAIGPLVGGALTDSLGWRSVFYLNIPIGIAAIAMTTAKVAESRDPAARRIDWAGLTLFSGALLTLVLGLLRGNAEGWGSPVILSLFGAAAVLMTAFVLVEQRVKDPMLPLSLFRIPAFTGVQLAAFGLSASMFSVFLYLTLYLQNELGYGPLQAGIRYLPMTVASFLIAPLAGSLIGRVHTRVLIGTGLGLTGAGLVISSNLSTSSGWTALLPGFILAGLGIGMANPAIADAALSSVSKDRAGMAAGVNDAFRQVAISLGVAAWGALFLNRGADKIAQATAGTQSAQGSHPRQLIEAASSGHVDQAVQSLPAGSRGSVATAAHEGFIAGLNDVLLIAGLVSIAGAIAAFWLIRERDLERVDLEAVEEPERIDGPALPEPAAA